MPSAAESAGGGEPNPAVAERMRIRREAGLSPEERQRRNVEQLIAAGFAPDRAEWINRRTQELRMQAMQAQYEARRDGRPQPPGSDEGAALRAELGDADYERFLTAMGRSTTVNVDGVLASSPAERSGLQPGDEIVAYNGKRVFDVAELNELTLGGTTGESVVVDVRRNGQTLQLVMPRGPLGIWGGRGPPSFLER
jgi:S1-C subfamily serine protease